MTNFNPANYVNTVNAIARAAGVRILEIYEREFKVEQKADRSPLTEADRAAHELISAQLNALTPNIPVLSEESAEIDYATRAAWPRFWLVDPLDGTKEFINRNGEFTVNIALIEDRRAVLGVVYVPVTRVMYFAGDGLGAFKQLGESAAIPIRVRRYAGKQPIVVASRSHAGPETEAFLKSLGEHHVISMGSALKLCLVAEGAADVYPRLGPTMEWDTAAAQCVVEAAGGRVTDMQRQALAYNKSSLLNPWFLVSGAGDYDWYRHLPAA
ncbi:MAG: 3'(2'),5'-bisphosphate nucleotidase CysQ [Gammaproteobacteria bacterium]|nr:3'(2'),5'-bisphosphate nucleotidase CysQ [Gammaproteobacteria bacterium]